MFIGQLIISTLLASVISAGGQKKKQKQESQILVWESSVADNKVVATKKPDVIAPTRNKVTKKPAAAPTTAAASALSAPSRKPVETKPKKEKSASGFINPYIDGVLAQGRPRHDSSYKVEITTPAKKPTPRNASTRAGSPNKKPRAQLSSDSFLNQWRPVNESSGSEEELEQVFEILDNSDEENEDQKRSQHFRKPCRKPKPSKPCRKPCEKPPKPCPKPEPKPCSSTTSSITSEVPCPPSSSSSSSSSHHCVERPNPFLDCSQEQAIAVVHEKNELFGKYWSAHKYNLIYASDLVHLEATYRIKEIGSDGKCVWMEGNIYDYIEQPGTFKSFVEKYTWNKGNRSITVTVLEVGNVEGEVVVRRVKRKYMSLRGCEYALWTVIGENSKCCPDKTKAIQ